MPQCLQLSKQLGENWSNNLIGGLLSEISINEAVLGIRNMTVIDYFDTSPIQTRYMSVYLQQCLGISLGGPTTRASQELRASSFLDTFRRLIVKKNQTAVFKCIPLTLCQFIYTLKTSPPKIPKTIFVCGYQGCYFYTNLLYRETFVFLVLEMLAFVLVICTQNITPV